MRFTPYGLFSMRTDFQAVIFDLDGVIINSEPLHERAQRIVFEEYTLDVPDLFYEEVKGKTEEQVFEYAIRTYARQALDPAELVARKHQVYDEVMADLQPVDGALAFIQQLHRTGMPLGLTTSATQANQQRAFEMFELAPYFQTVVTVADISRPKPDPDPYLTTAAQLGIPPEECLVVEDSQPGVLSARRAGCTVAGITTTLDADVLREAGAHTTVDQFHELAHLLGLAPVS